MKTKEELNALKDELASLNKKLAELSEEELKQVSGGDFLGPVLGDVTHMVCQNPDCGKDTYWAGYFKFRTFQCPYCGEMTFKGESYGL